MQKLEMSTTWLPILQPGLYGTELGNILELCYDNDKIKEDFQKQLCHVFESKMNEIFNEDWFVEEFGNVTVSNCVFKSPQFYNFENDSINFDLEIKQPFKAGLYYQKLKLQGKHDCFHKYIKYNFGSHPGFNSAFPYEVYDFKCALFEVIQEKRKNMIITVQLECYLHTQLNVIVTVPQIVIKRNLKKLWKNIVVAMVCMIMMMIYIKERR